MAKEGQKINYVHKGERKSVIIDRQLLKNILNNLLSNAIKYSSENKEINFTTDSTNDQNDLIITIQDFGMGIPDEDKPLLFERFFRAQNAGNIQGTGLGLNIVKKYVELIDGDISFVSKLNTGTTFTVRIFNCVE
jgi:signal transduction histidine kinase